MDLTGQPKLALNPRGVSIKTLGLPKLYYLRCLNKAWDRFSLNSDVIFDVRGCLPGHFWCKNGLFLEWFAVCQNYDDDDMAKGTVAGTMVQRNARSV